MAKRTKECIYLSYLDQILSGEEDIGPVEESEIKELLLLAKTMIAADFSVDSKTREKLRKQILAQVSKKNKSSLTVLSSNDDELDEEALGRVAAGFAGQDEEQKEMMKHIKLPGNQKNRD